MLGKLTSRDIKNTCFINLLSQYSIFVHEAPRLAVTLWSKKRHNPVSNRTLTLIRQNNNAGSIVKGRKQEILRKGGIYYG
jgi:hypothetical protein